MNDKEKILNFYKVQGERTKVDPGTFDDFPDDISKICKIIQGIIVHPEALKLYGLKLSKERIKSRYNKTIQESINQIKSIQDDSLLIGRVPENRVVNICRHFSMFLCSVLREKGIPARCRCGFATYFVNGWFDDHWICEYWNAREEKWIRVDSQLDDIQAKACFIDMNKTNPTNLLGESFFSGAVLWKLFRQGLVSGELCGFSPEEGEAGEWYIRGNMLRDFFALNKMEYTYQEEARLMSRGYKPNKDDLLFLDKVADLTLEIDDRFEEFRYFSDKNQINKF